MTAGAPIRLMTWNIHRAIGPDGAYDLDRVAAVIGRHRPDVIALQEVDTRGILELEARPLAVLARSFGPHAVEARTIVAPDGHYGHAVLSRWPLVDAETVELTVRDYEPRSAILCTAETPGGALGIATVHLGLAPGERRLQAGRVLAALAARARPSVLMGDFNDWLGVGVVRRRLAAALGAPTALATFPARLPLFSLDRLYCPAPLRILRSWTDRTAAGASDHLPVIADVGFAAEGGERPPPPAS